MWGLGPHEWDLGWGEEILMGFGVKSMGFGAFGLQNISLRLGAMIHAGFGVFINGIWGPYQWVMGPRAEMVSLWDLGTL